MNEAQIVFDLVIAVGVAVTVVRFWRQIVAFVVAVMVGLSVIGLLTVISWCQALPKP